MYFDIHRIVWSGGVFASFLVYNLLSSLDYVIRYLVIQGSLTMREGGILIVLICTLSFIISLSL